MNSKIIITGCHNCEYTKKLNQLDIVHRLEYKIITLKVLSTKGTDENELLRND